MSLNKIWRLYRLLLTTGKHLVAGRRFKLAELLFGQATYLVGKATLDTLEAQGVAVFPVNIKAAGDGIDSPGAGPADGRLQASTIADATGGEIAHNLDGTTQSLVRDAIIEAILSAEGGTPSEVGTTGQQVCCGPGDFGDIKITVGSQDAADTILRVRAVPEGLVFEAVGERLEDIR